MLGDDDKSCPPQAMALALISRTRLCLHPPASRWKFETEYEVIVGAKFSQSPQLSLQLAEALPNLTIIDLTNRPPSNPGGSRKVTAGDSRRFKVGYKRSLPGRHFGARQVAELVVY